MCNVLRRSPARHLHHGLHCARAITSRLLQRPQRNRAEHEEAVPAQRLCRRRNNRGCWISRSRAGRGAGGGGGYRLWRGVESGEGGAGGGGRGGGGAGVGGRRGGDGSGPRPWPPDGARAGGASPALSEPPPAPRPPPFLGRVRASVSHFVHVSVDS